MPLGVDVVEGIGVADGFDDFGNGLVDMLVDGLANVSNGSWITDVF